MQVNQNYSEISPHTGQNVDKQQMLERVGGIREPSCTVGGNVNWYTHYGEQYEVP